VVVSCASDILPAGPIEGVCIVEGEVVFTVESDIQESELSGSAVWVGRANSRGGGQPFRGSDCVWRDDDLIGGGRIERCL
jgi:hypothetical protein